MRIDIILRDGPLGIINRVETSLIPGILALTVIGTETDIALMLCMYLGMSV